MGAPMKVELPSLDVNARRLEKQQAREADSHALSVGQKSPAQLSRENDAFSGVRLVMNLKNVRRLS